MTVAVTIKKERVICPFRRAGVSPLVDEFVSRHGNSNAFG
jgi:hypothetical protein